MIKYLENTWKILCSGDKTYSCSICDCIKISGSNDHNAISVFHTITKKTLILVLDWNENFCSNRRRVRSDRREKKEIWCWWKYILRPPTKCIRDDEEGVEGRPHYKPFERANNHHHGWERDSAKIVMVIFAWKYFVEEWKQQKWRLPQ